MPSAEPPEPAALLDLARPLAEAAGRQLAEARRAERPSVTTKTSVTDYVTELDCIVERTLTDGILAARPHDTVVGEEGAAEQGTSGVTWHIDPIDGTVNFVHGIPGFCVSVAADHDGIPVAGVVVSPLHGEVFTATAGGGAWCNDRPITCSGAREIDMAVVATGFSYVSRRRARQAQVLARLLPQIADVRRMGAAALDLCWVAAGRYDGTYHLGLNTWDYTAGWLIATEAGAEVGDLAGGPPSPAYVLAAAPELFDPLRSLLLRCGATTIDDDASWGPLEHP